jgi:hypothetical protein
MQNFHFISFPLFDCETLSPNLKEEYRLRVRTELGKLFERRRGDVERNAIDEEFHN